MIKGALRPVATVTLAGGAALALLFTAGAASDLQVTGVDCVSHPRKIALQNLGDTAQNLAGWKLLSNKPGEEFDLTMVGAVAPGEAFFVFNGHGSQPEPYQSGGQWIYPWNYTDVLDESKFVLTADGTDFIRLVDATGFPWREVSNMRCPDNTTEIPPLEQLATPTPSNADPATGGNPGQTDGNQATSAQSDSTEQGAANQNAPAANTTAQSGTTTTAQAANVSGQLVGAPASGVGLLSSSSAPPDAHSLALAFLGVIAGAALALLGLRTICRALRCP